MRRSIGPPRCLPTGIAPADILALEPIHMLSDGSLRGARAMLRQDGTLARDFAWLLHAACIEAHGWNVWTVNPPRVAVESPSGEAIDTRFVDEVAAALAGSGLAPSALEIELALPERARADAPLMLAVAALRDLGIGVTLCQTSSPLDDLRRLQRLPVTCVRLRAFDAGDLAQDHRTRSEIAGMIASARGAGILVIATNVQTSMDCDISAVLGCDAAQGALFGPPMPARIFRGSLRSAALN